MAGEGAATRHLEATPQECHGCCYGHEAERDAWAAPLLLVSCAAEARPGYDSMNASEYEDAPEVLRAKVEYMAELILSSKCCIVYSGAGLSTSAGIGDYASQAPESLGGGLAALAQAAGRPGSSYLSPFCAQPTLAHRVLVALHAAGRVHRWINQNHDGLPQKAGLPQEAINEIHGAWHAPDNPVIPMSGSLREDLYADLLDCERTGDLVIAVGTSLCGMNADRVVAAPAQRAADGVPGQLGAVVVGLQRTALDSRATLRLFGRCDDVFDLLARTLADARVARRTGVEEEELIRSGNGALDLRVAPAWAENTYFQPPVLVERPQDSYVFTGLPYDAAGERSTCSTSTWDLREDAELVITRGMHAGARGVVDGFDREGNIKCRFKLRPKSGKLRAQVSMLLGRWWIQAAVDGKVCFLPVVNLPAEDAAAPGARRLRELLCSYEQ